MALLDSLRDLLRRESCTKLIHYDGRSLTVNSLGVDLPPFKINVGGVESHLTVLRQAGDAATALDDYQFLLCQELKSLPAHDPSRAHIITLRTNGILWMTALRTALSSYSLDADGQRATLVQVTKDVSSRMLAAATDPTGGAGYVAGSPAPPPPPPPGGRRHSGPTGAAVPDAPPARTPDLTPSPLVLELTRLKPHDVAALASDVAKG